ncbi:hypothetical protein V6N13_138259 [Hibiscus sabdariffa]
MEAEVVVPLPTVEFNFDSSCSSSYITAPSSSQYCGSNLLVFTVPTSPSHDSYGDFNDVSRVFGSSPTSHFERESKQSGKFEAESTIGVYARAALHSESSGDKGYEVEDFLALQTGLAWVSTLVCMSFL